MPVPIPTPIYRFLHLENLAICLERGALHAPNHTPNDGRVYRTIHNVDIQQKRRVARISCGPCGVIHDYVSFYLGPRSPRLYQLHTGWVPGYTEGQAPLVYVVSSAQAIQQSGTPFVFSDGHGIAAYTRWFDDLAHLDQVDWAAVGSRIWKDTIDDMDRQRRKQAEFLAHVRCDWARVHEVAVLNDQVRLKVEAVLGQFPETLHRPVRVRPGWYY